MNLRIRAAVENSENSLKNYHTVSKEKCIRDRICNILLFHRVNLQQRITVKPFENCR